MQNRSRRASPRHFWPGANLWQIVMCFLYNKQYMTRMLTSGWVLADSEGHNALAAAKLGVVLSKAIPSS